MAVVEAGNNGFPAAVHDFGVFARGGQDIPVVADLGDAAVLGQKSRDEDVSLNIDLSVDKRGTAHDKPSF